MKPLYSAVVKVDTPRVIALQFARPLSPETAIKIQNLDQNEGIMVLEIPKHIGKLGYYVVFSDNWEKTTVAKECVSILVSEGFAESDIFADF